MNMSLSKIHKILKTTAMTYPMQRDLYLGKHSKFKSNPFLISSVQSTNLITKCLSQTQNKTFSVFSKRALVRFRDYLNKFKL